MRTEFFKDTFVFDVGEKQWLRATGSGPSARSGHHSCIVGRTMYTFGGEFCNAVVFNEYHYHNEESTSSGGRRIPSPMEAGWRLQDPRDGCTGSDRGCSGTRG